MRKFLVLFVMATSSVMTHKIERRCCECPAEPKVIVGRSETAEPISFGQAKDLGKWRQDTLAPTDTCCPCTAKDMYPFIIPDAAPE